MGCLPQAAWPERLLSEKSGRRIAADYDAARLPMIDRGDIRQAPTVAATFSFFTAGRWLRSPEHKADSLIAKFKEAGGTVRD